MLFPDPYQRRSGLWNRQLLYFWGEYFRSAQYLLKCISYSHLSGPTKYITCTGLCSWSFLSFQRSPFASLLSALIFYSTLKTIDGMPSLIIEYNLKSDLFFDGMSGSGQVFYRALQLLVMYIYIRFITTFSKPKCMDSFKLFSTSDIWRYSVRLWV